MNFKTQGLVIREQHTGESDRIITVLTRDRGVLRAFANRARKLNSKNASATQLLAYSAFGIYRSRDAYIIDQAEPLEVFFELRGDLEKLSLAQYFCELAMLLAPQEEQAEDFLRLVLNSLHILVKGSRPQTLVKAVFEMRILSLAGYMPDLVCCEGCKAYEADVMYFLPCSGRIICGDCFRGEGQEALPLGRGVLTALRHAIYAKGDRLFSFALPKAALKVFGEAAERYLLCNVDKKPATLEFYRGIAAEK